nr:DUF3331 domain-containing protein [Paraburkholderia sp. USG1]
MLNTQTVPSLSESPAESDDSRPHQPSIAHPPAEAALIGLSHGRGRVGRRRPTDASVAEKDPWLRTLAALQRFSEPPDGSFSPFAQPEYRYPPSRRAAGDSQMKTFNLTVLEHMANSRVCLSWHDPTLCNYEEQVWTPGLARRSGRCALSGAHIRRGDAVYRPQTRGSTPPANSDAMILTSALEQVRDG